MRPKKKISQNDIARALGISNVSVSNALAGRKGVSDDLIRKVCQTASEMGYEMGKGSADNCRNVVAIVTPADGTAGTAGIDETAGAAGAADRLAELLRAQRFQAKHYVLHEILDERNAALRDLEKCSGILLPEPLTVEELLFLRKNCGRPVIGIGFFDPHVPIDYVMDDGFHGAQLMVQYLRGKGYERILYVKPDADADVTDAQTAMWEDRLLGYRSELYLETLNRGLTMEQAQPFDTEETRGILTVSEARAYIENLQDDAEGQDGGQKRDRAGEWISGQKQNNAKEQAGGRKQNSAEDQDGGRKQNSAEDQDGGRKRDRAGEWISGQKQNNAKEQAGVRKQNSAEHPQRPRTAFFCGDMKTARVLQEYLTEKQIAVPGEAGVAGYLAGGESDLQQEEMQAGQEQAGQGRIGRITAYENSSERLLEQCCVILREKHRGEKTGTLHPVSGAVIEGCSA